MFLLLLLSFWLHLELEVRDIWRPGVDPVRTRDSMAQIQGKWQPCVRSLWGEGPVQMVRVVVCWWRTSADGWSGGVLVKDQYRWLEWWCVGEGLVQMVGVVVCWSSRLFVLNMYDRTMFCSTINCQSTATSNIVKSLLQKFPTFTWTFFYKSSVRMNKTSNTQLTYEDHAWAGVSVKWKIFPHHLHDLETHPLPVYLTRAHFQWLTAASLLESS